MVQIGKDEESQKLCCLNVSQEKETLKETWDREYYVTSIDYEEKTERRENP